MQFIKTDTWETGTVALAQRLSHELAGGKRVLWLVCGGSNIAASVNIMRILPDTNTKNLTILLTDERYGPIGHEDSNSLQLTASGFVQKQATMLPVLVADYDLEETRQHYNDIALQAFSDAELIIGQFGIGPDGHIAGILPHSPAVASTDFVAAYEAPPFIRMTLTFHALKRLTAAYAMVFGDNKHHAMEQLEHETLPYADQPSQILKELPEAYVYNDQVGGDA